ncbi:phospholipid-translocating P-type ATPase [Meredithblackwellia eburnea MCA 4105]
MVGGLSRFLHPHHREPEEEQYVWENGERRDLSDTTHPNYDPATDPELRLRVTHTAVESIHESIREEDRRRVKRLGGLGRKLTLSSPTPSSPNPSLKPRRSLFSRSSRRRKGAAGGGDGDDTTNNNNQVGSPILEGSEDGHTQVVVEEANDDERAKLERQRNQANAAAEAEESARRQERQDAKRKGSSGGGGKRGKKVGGSERRVVFVNMEGPMSDPRTYERNKVRTSKYTLLTFLPKNLTEQFRRVANIYFLLLIVLQFFSIFGAAAPQVAALPLLAILAITGIKDAIEDYRRQILDNDVNNSAVTRLGDWKNVNQIEYETPWWQFWAPPSSKRGGVSKGVRKLREKEGVYDSGFLYEGKPRESHDNLEELSSAQAGGGGIFAGLPGPNDSSYTIDETSYPPPPPQGRPRSLTLESVPYSQRSGRSGRTSTSDVVSYNHPTPGTAKWERTLWKKLEVGDIVLLKENDQIPADIVVLSSSDSDGVCFVETKNLDGETNLKPRKSLKATMGIGNEEDVEHARFWIDSEAPHANLYSYNGVLKYRTSGDSVGREHPVIEGRSLDKGSEVEEPITINELLLRGCSLRNTKWVIGIVLFTGADTKIMLNQGETPSKRSKIEKETNFNVLVNFGVLMALCIGCALADGIYENSDNTSAKLYEPNAEVSPYPVVGALVTFGASLIMFQNIVPISLVITVELVKTLQALFIFQDIDMYYEPLDHPCVPKTWNISDDLGQIEYVFSDKTGTLTQNVMEFQKCAVDGMAYGEGITEAMLGAAKREGKDTSAFDPAQNVDQLASQKAKMISTMRSSYKNRYLQEEALTLISPSLAASLATRNEHQQKLIEFWRALALCHTVLADRPDPENPDHVVYKAESPDEAALVAAARDMGFVFLNRTNSEIEIEVMGQPERYTPLRVLEFNSTRKRMSTLVRTPDGRILLICKGADSVIYQRLRKDHDPHLIESTSKHLEDFANAGLRTLCISSKYLTAEEFARWSRIYDKACAAVEDREEEIARACELVEEDLTIIGATALEDKLQVGVPEAIEQLHKAGLKLWILTGDKLQTAIEIGFSCNLLSNDMEIMIISSESEEGARVQIEQGLEKLARGRSGVAPIDEKESKKGGFAVVIDGETLSHALDDNLKPMFLELTTQCDTVVCCRVSPSQKALTVKLVKDGKNAMTLAIGDGANDVAMIQEAHVGVGIAGLEGAQASMSADYAVGQFRYLTKLLLVHGRWCYIRVADMSANFFLKNITWTITLFWYQLFCNFDGLTMYDYTLIMLFNLVFTSLPVAILGIFDQDVNAAYSQLYPQLYRRGILGLEFNRAIFFAFMADGLYQSAVAFFIPYFVYNMASTLSVTGRSFSLWEFSTTVAACAVTLCNLFVGLHIRYWTWMVWVIIIGSTLAFHVWIAIYSQFDVFTFESELFYLYTTLNFWTCIVFTAVAGVGPKFLYKYVQSAYFPRDNDIIRERQVKKLDDRKVSVYDYEAQEHHGPADGGASTQAKKPNPLRERTLSDNSEMLSSNYHEQSPFGLNPSRIDVSQTGGVPTINIDSATPRTSFQSSNYHHGGGHYDQHEYSGSQEWEYNVVAATSPGAVTPTSIDEDYGEDPLGRRAVAQGHTGYAL